MENDIIFQCFPLSLSWDVWSCVRRRGESAASSPSGSFVRAAASEASTPMGTPLRSHKATRRRETRTLVEIERCSLSFP